MFDPDLSSRGRSGHSQHVLKPPSSWLRVLALLLLLISGCGAESGDDDDGSAPGQLWRTWVMGGQTGALTPPCGLTPAARAGDSIPGGDSGFVIHTDACVGFSAAELELHDEDGMMVAFDLEPLPDGALLVRPRSPLPAGVYRLTIGGVEMEPVVAMAPEELPMRIGTLRPNGPLCGVQAELTVDPLLLEYVPQLKLSVSVDDAPERTWFDFGELELDDGRALISLPCNQERCVTDGEHRLRVTAELAGELGTLEPVEVPVQVRCAESAGAGATPPRNAGNDDGSGGAYCAVREARSSRASPGLEPTFAGLVLGWLLLRRRRRSST